MGNLQADYVEHCGRSNGGDYIHTVSLADTSLRFPRIAVVPEAQYKTAAVVAAVGGATGAERCIGAGVLRAASFSAEATAPLNNRHL